MSYPQAVKKIVTKRFGKMSRIMRDVQEHIFNQVIYSNWKDRHLLERITKFIYLLLLERIQYDLSSKSRHLGTTRNISNRFSTSKKCFATSNCRSCSFRLCKDLWRDHRSKIWFHKSLAWRYKNSCTGCWLVTSFVFSIIFYLTVIFLNKVPYHK